METRSAINVIGPGVKAQGVKVHFRLCEEFRMTKKPLERLLVDAHCAFLNKGCVPCTTVTDMLDTTCS